jgi:UTP:GlnB (protein PII) uridylyltransferase
MAESLSFCNLLTMTNHRTMKRPQIETRNVPGLLTAITSTFRDLGLDVAKASVDGKDGMIKDQFSVWDMKGQKLSDK